MRFHALALVCAVGLATAACDVRTTASGDFSFDIAAGKATDTWSRTYPVPADGRFELINVNGRITAEPADGKDLVVEGRRSAKARTDEAAKELLEKLEIREEVGTSTIRVEARPPRLSGFSGHEIEWTVKVPKGVTVDLRTVNGGVRMTGLTGKLYAKTTNGGVRAKDIIAEVVEVSSVNGGVEVELGAPLDSSASIEMTTVNGGVSLGLPAESKATISARAVNGGVRVSELSIKRDDERDTDFERRRRLNGTLNGGGGRVNISVTNGGVRIGRVGSSTS